MAETDVFRKSVFQRVAAIVAEMPAVGKGQKNAQQGFMFRGHDDVMNALNPLLSKHGVFFVPNVVERVADQRKTKQGGIMYEVNLLVEYAFYGPDGDSFTASAWGEGTDSGDKSTNKAMTMALKNVLAQTFAVSTEEQSRYDTDQHTDEPSAGRDSAFDPSQSIVPGAPTGWPEIQALILDLDLSLGDWVAEAILKLYGTPASEIHDGEVKRQVFCRTSNTLYRITDLFKDGDFPPPTDDEYREMFAWGFDGVALDGPGVPFDVPEMVEEFSKAVQEGTGDDLSGTDAEQGQDSLLGPGSAPVHRDPTAEDPA